MKKSQVKENKIMSTKRNNGIKFFDTTETEPKNIITMDGLKNSTTDAYNKSDYKWDPQLKKTVYVGKKKTIENKPEKTMKPENQSNKEMNTEGKHRANEKETIEQKVSKIVGENGKYRYGGYEPGSGHYLEFYFDGNWKRYNELTETEKEKQKKWDETYNKILMEAENKNNENKKEMLKKIKEVASGKKAQSRENAYYYMQYADSQATNKNNTDKEKETWRDLHMKLVDKYHDYR